MVSARMVAVLAVTILLLCGNVQSAKEGTAAFVTQVITAPVMAPATINTTEGSDTTDRAVLTTEEQGPSSALAMAPAMAPAITSAPEPSPSASSIPFLVEAEAPAQSSTEEEAPEPAAAGPDSTPMGAREAFAADPPVEGHLVTGDFPPIRDGDHSGGRGYGVLGDRADGEPFAAMGARAAFAADPPVEGHLVTGDFPPIRDGDHSGGRGYGVLGDRADGEPFAAMGARAAFAADPPVEGHLVTGDFPPIRDGDHSGGRGYGVLGDRADGEPFGSIDEDTASESNTSDTTRVTLKKFNTYSSIPKSKATWGKGKCTFYGGMDATGTMSGACGYGNLYASGYGAYSASLSSVLFKNGMACGACYEVACSGANSCKPGSVIVTVTNFCAPNPGRSADNGGWCNGANQHFELSYPAFAKIADPKAGIVALNYRRIPCKKQGGIRFTLNGHCNFNLVTITNVGGSGVVTEVYMKGDKMDWAPLSRNWGANWQCSRNYCGKGISIKIVTSDKKVSVSKLAGPEWAFGKTYIGQQVY